ncbi:MAG: DUF4231 domain-containing protein [Cyanobacteria bacterium J06639_14]
MANEPAPSEKLSANAPTVSPPKQLLIDAWERQIIYSRNASRYQKRFATLRTMLTILSVGVIFLSIVEADVDVDFLPEVWANLTYGSIENLLIILPITITALLAFSVKFDRGQNWVLLRGNAEALKREIYYYRTMFGPYKENRDAVLAQRVKQISESMKGSPVHRASLNPYESLTPAEKRQADLYAPEKYSDFLSAEKYLTYRLERQFDWYRKQAKSLDRQLQIFQFSIYAFGGLGTFLAATDNLKSWVAVTTALTGAFNNYVEFKRVESSLVGYNQTADTLYDIRTWWHSLSASARENRQNFKKLVESTEKTIRSENTSWLQDMQDLLADLYGTKEVDEPDPQSEAPSPSPEEEKN